jgi:hypothetical protein
MKRYAFLAQFLLLFGLTITTQAGCGEGRGGGARAAVDWRIYDLDDVNATTPMNCAAVGAAWVVVKLTNFETQETFTDNFPCDDRYWEGVTAGVPAGYYTATLELHAASPAYPGASTLLDAYVMPTKDTYLLEVGTSSLDPIDFFVNRFAPSWRIYRGGVEVSCAQAGATGVDIDIYYPGQDIPRTYSFSCTDPQPASFGIPMGNYIVGWQAILTRPGQDIALTDPANFSVQNDAMAVLPLVAFAVP